MQSTYFTIRVGIHQYQFLYNHNGPDTGRNRKGAPFVILFADDLAICEHSRPEVELQLERWRDN